MSDSEFDDRPWNEAKWERFMLESDVRSARFGELLETLIDDPNCDEIIAREMGWDHLYGEDDGAAFAIEDPLPDDENLLDDSVGDEAEDEVRSSREALESLPAYTVGHRWALQVHEALKPYFAAEGDEPDEDVEAALACFSVAAKIAGGHGMGYEDDVLCGNIVRCKRGLAAAIEALDGLTSLRRRGTVPASTLDRLIADGQHVQELVEQHIADMRCRVWWD